MAQHVFRCKDGFLEFRASLSRRPGETGTPLGLTAVKSQRADWTRPGLDVKSIKGVGLVAEWNARMSGEVIPERTVQISDRLMEVNGFPLTDNAVLRGECAAAGDDADLALVVHRRLCGTVVAGGKYRVEDTIQPERQVASLEAGEEVTALELCGTPARFKRSLDGSEQEVWVHSSDFWKLRILASAPEFSGEQRLAKVEKRRRDLEDKVSGLLGEQERLSRNQLQNGHQLDAEERLSVEQGAVKKLAKEVQRLEDMARMTMRARSHA